MNSRRTLWTEGRFRGRLVVNAAGVTLIGVSAADLALNRHLTLVFDVAFVLTCVAAALAVRPRDFFVTGVLPPLLMLAALVMLALAARGDVADARDGLIQAVVSGLAHRAGALVVGYALTLGVLALRQVALKNQGALRRAQPPRPVVPAQRARRAPAQRPVPRRQVEVAEVETAEVEARALRVAER